jgi:hypothetical protein
MHQTTPIICNRYYSDESQKSTKSDFRNLHRQASTNVKLIQQVLSSSSHKDQVAVLRRATSNDSLWCNDAEAANLLQQLSILEKREAEALHLETTLSNAAELFGWSTVTPNFMM